MKALLLMALTLTTATSFSQYYYKDIIGTRETTELIRLYRENKVRRVVLNSFDADNTRIEDFFVQQTFSPTDQALVTVTRSGVTGESTLTSYTNHLGQVIKTVDSTVALVSVTLYGYDEQGQLTTLRSTSTDSSGQLVQNEEHIWEYSHGQVARMQRVKNQRDTSVFAFKGDNAGNVIEERTIRSRLPSEPVYYYYDAQNRLTDIVRYHPKAQRLLPEYMFEYSGQHQVIQKITVPANGSQYLIWRYQYDNRGLKIREAVFNKQKELTGKIEYHYAFDS